MALAVPEPAPAPPATFAVRADLVVGAAPAAPAAVAGIVLEAAAMSLAAGLALGAGLVALPAVLLARIQIGALPLAAGLAGRALARAARARAAAIAADAFAVHARGGFGATVAALAAVVRIGPDPDAPAPAHPVAPGTRAVAPATAVSLTDEGGWTAPLATGPAAVRTDAHLAIPLPAAFRLPGTAAVSAALVATLALELPCRPRGRGDQPRDCGPARSRAGEEFAAGESGLERRRLFRRRPALEAWNRAGQERLDRRSARCHPARDPPVGSDEDRSRGALGAVRVGHLAVTLKQHVSAPVLVRSGLRFTPTVIDHGDGEIGRMITLPLGDFGSEGDAGPAVRVGEDEQDGPPSVPQRRERDGRAFERWQLELGRGASERKAP